MLRQVSQDDEVTTMQIKGCSSSRVSSADGSDGGKDEDEDDTVVLSPHPAQVSALALMAW